MSSFVLDTSIALKWFLEDEDDRTYSLAILQAITDDYRPIVPWLWYYEIANNLLTQVHRKRISSENVTPYLRIIDEMLIDVDPPDRSRILHLSALARDYQLTVYDGAFLELANRLDLPLATADRGLIRAASQAGVQLLPHPNVA